MSFIPLPITDPTWIFFVVLGVILFTPMLLERLRIPSIVGLIVVGVVIGPHGVHLLNRDASFEIFGKVGLLLYYVHGVAQHEPYGRNAPPLCGALLRSHLVRPAFRPRAGG